MAQGKGDAKQLTRGQYERLGWFLVASAFLVAVFVQLVLADKNSALVNVCTLRFLVHAVAILGMLISALYFFMNFSLWLRHALQLETIHTFLIPALFLLFWLIAWYVVTCRWFAFPVVGGFLLLCLIFQKHRHAIISRLLINLPTLWRPTLRLPSLRRHK